MPKLYISKSRCWSFLLQKKCFWKFYNIHRKIPVLEWLFYKDCNFIKKRRQHRCFPVNLARFFKYLFYRTPPRDSFFHISSKSFRKYFERSHCLFFFWKHENSQISRSSDSAFKCFLKTLITKLTLICVSYFQRQPFRVI